MGAADLLRTRIVDNMIEALEAIDKEDGYNYTPDVVAPRPVDPPQYAVVYDQTEDLVYMVCPADIPTDRHYASGGTQRAILEVYVFGSYLYNRGQVNPLKYDGISRDEVRDKIVDDIKKALWSDATRGGLASNTDIRSIRPVIFSYPELQNMDTPDLAAVEVLFEIEYFYKRGDIG
jgi:hypothetical protein